MSDNTDPPRQAPRQEDIDDIDEVLDELTIHPDTPEQDNRPVPSLVHRGHDFAYGVRPMNMLTPPRRAHGRGDDIDNEEDRGGYYPTLSAHHLPQTPRSRPPTRDAQNEYPATACVFVANLPQPKSDEELQSALEAAFSAYGTVFIKVRRDPKTMPFAFAQYTNDHDAEMALNNGQGMMILGRGCRIEPPRAARLSYYVTRHDGRDMTEQEASDVMSELGRISNIAVLDSRRSEALNIRGISFGVQYQMWNAARDIASAFRDDPIYRAGTLTDIPRNPRPAPRYSNYRTPRRGFSAVRDARTIWVSNLHGEITEAQLYDLVAGFGPVVELIIKPSKPYDTNRSEYSKSFAFVEFETEEQAQDAAEQLHGTPGTHGLILKVELKRAKESLYASSQPSLRQRYAQQDSFETPSRYEEEMPRESARRHTDRPRNNRLLHDCPQHQNSRPQPQNSRTQPSPQVNESLIRSPHETEVTTSPAAYMPGPDPSISDYTPAPAFPTMPTIPFQGPYQMPGFAPGFQFPMGMPMGNMGYNVFGGPAHYGPVYHTPGPYDPMAAFHTYTAPPFVLGGFAPTDPFQGPPATRSEPTGGTEEEENKGKEKEEGDEE